MDNRDNTPIERCPPRNAQGIDARGTRKRPSHHQRLPCGGYWIKPVRNQS